MNGYFGRKKIKTDVLNITRGNVVEVLEAAMQDHEVNRSQINYLWKVYKGEVPVYGKQKEFRKNINNILSENRAMQIVEFYQGYVFGEPIQYVRRGKNESLNDEIEWLNATMEAKDKLLKDNELAEWLLVSGVCPRLVLPNKDGDFDMYTLDPRYAFNVYGNELGEPVLMSVKYIIKEDNSRVFSVYTKDAYYVIVDDHISKSESHILGEPPITEYCLNNARIGIFESVLTLLDAINTLQSNRMDDVQQYVNSILTILGGQIDEETMAKVNELGAMCLPDSVDAKYLNALLSQSDTQVLKDDIMVAITEITGMPNRNGGSSTSDTGSAVLLRDGWEIADSKSKRIEIQFKGAEKRVIGQILRYCKRLSGKGVTVSDIGMQFTRRNYEAVQSKATVLNMMLSNGKIHPELAFQHSGMFSDPLTAYSMSKEYYEKEVKPHENHNGQASTASKGTETSEG